MMRPSRRDLRIGFSLMEILIVIAIVGILAALVFGVVGRAKDSAFSTVDISNMRQIYAAIVLYEDSNNEMAPPTLLDLYPTWVSSQDVFRAPTDPVRKPNPKLGGYSAEMFFGSDRRSPFRISFGYLKVFPPYDKLQGEWLKKRTDPLIGMLASPWHGTPRKSHFEGRGLFDDFGPPMDGPILRINMDGSFFRLPRNRYQDVVGSVQDFFFLR